MVIFSLYIISKAGTPMFHQDFIPALQNRPDDPHRNFPVVLASTFHTMHAIAGNLSPTQRGGGIEVLETDTFKLHCLQTATSLKFFVVADTSHPNLDGFLQSVYNLYIDYALKNPFYRVDQPIHCEQFDIELGKLMQQQQGQTTTPVDERRP